MKKVWKVKTNLTQDENKKLMSSMTDEDHDLMKQFVPSENFIGR